MLCYECSRDKTRREAVGLCNHCSVALCPDHACIVNDPVTAIYPISKTVVLPKKARLLLCAICRSAYEQVRTVALASETSSECCVAVSSGADQDV